MKTQSLAIRYNASGDFDTVQYEVCKIRTRLIMMCVCMRASKLVVVRCILINAIERNSFMPQIGCCCAKTYCSIVSFLQELRSHPFRDNPPTQSTNSY